MSVIETMIRQESDGTLSFGNYLLAEKKKVLDFEVDGRFYKAKSFKEVTKLKKDGALVYESLPGTAVHHFKATEEGVSFLVEGYATTQITLELEPEAEYQLFIEDVLVGSMCASVAGKIIFSVEAKQEPKVVVLKKSK
jgi:hypothetical protein